MATEWSTEADLARRLACNNYSYFSFNYNNYETHKEFGVVLLGFYYADTGVGEDFEQILRYLRECG